jgi:hypothetical protein
LEEATTFPFIIFFVFGHGACNQMSFCRGTPTFKILEIGILILEIGILILEIGTLTTLEAHSFLCKTLIDVRFEAKL